MLTIQAPPSKSVSHRTLMGAALARGESVVRHALMSKDIERTMHILTAAGATFTPLGDEEPGCFRVKGMGGMPQGTTGSAPPLSCDVHESGTTCRLLTAVLAAGQGRFRIHGAPRMHERPVGQLTDALEKLGVHVTFEGHPQCPPLVLDTHGMEGGAVDIGLDESSQYLSGLLLAAPLTRKGLHINLCGGKVVSWPYVGLTLQTMENFGVAFTVETRVPGGEWARTDWRAITEARPGEVRFLVPPGVYQSGDYTVEGDWSGASYFLAAGALGHKALRVTGLRADSQQGDRALLDIMQRMGAQITRADDGITVSPSPLSGARLDMGSCPDLVPTVAVLAAFAKGRTTITNVAHLRIKESDRIAAPAEELRKVGVTVEEHADGLSVVGLGEAPHVPEGTLFRAHGDHRIAMSTALLGLGQNMLIQVDTPEVVSKSFPHFWELWGTVLA